ncbi:MAG: VOC family protein [Pseudomonadales bacterium]
MILRQVALVANELAPIRARLFALLGLKADHVDPGVGEFGLHNSVMAIGDTFLEIVAPTQEGTSAGRLLERRGGDGGYMVLVQVDDIERYRQLTESLSIRKVWSIDRDDVRAFHVHPRDMGAAIVSFDQMIPEESWVWAGADWQDRRARHVSSISAVDIQGKDPESLARRWSKALDREVITRAGEPVIQLDRGRINFREAMDGRGDGVSGLEFEVADRAAVESAASALGLVWEENCVTVCGTRFRFGQATGS